MNAKRSNGMAVITESPGRSTSNHPLLVFDSISIPSPMQEHQSAQRGTGVQLCKDPDRSQLLKKKIAKTAIPVTSSPPRVWVAHPAPCQKARPPLRSTMIKLGLKYDPLAPERARQCSPPKGGVWREQSRATNIIARKMGPDQLGPSTSQYLLISEGGVGCTGSPGVPTPRPWAARANSVSSSRASRVYYRKFLKLQQREAPRSSAPVSSPGRKYASCCQFMHNGVNVRWNCTKVFFRVVDCWNFRDFPRLRDIGSNVR